MTALPVPVAARGIPDLSVPVRPRAWWGDRSVKAKILTAVGVAAAAAGIIGVSGIQAMSEATANAEQLYEVNLLGVAQVADMERTIDDLRITGRDAMLSTGAEDAQVNVDDLAEVRTAFDAAVEAYTATGMTPDRQALVDLVVKDVDVYEAFQRDTLGPLAVAGQTQQWIAINDTEGQPIVAELADSIADLRQLESDAGAEAIAGIQASSASQATAAITLMVVGLLAAVGVGLVVALGIARSTRRVQQVTDALAQGDLTRSTGMVTRDELGRMGHALDEAVESLRLVMGTVVSSAEAVAASSEELSASSAQISASAEETSVQSGVVSAAAEQVSRSVQTVAAGAEQMGASIREISTNASRAAQIAAQAVGAAKAANTTVNKLGDSSAEIGNVVKVITTIAAQTNLLALNATIEAARAGEAGKGFAVVANEVKELAQETAKATEDIARRVEAIQADTTGAVSAIEEISTIITSIDDYQTTIASAVEEQTATTNEMSRSVAEAAGGSGEIAVNITGVATAADSTTQALTQTQVAVDELSRMATELHGAVARFRY